MFLKTINITLGFLVAFSVWCAAVLVAIVLLQLAVVAGLTVFHLVQS